MLHSRMKRVAEEIRQEITSILTYDMADPRIPMATVTTVKVSNDLREAIVHVSFLEEDPETLDEAMAALNDAKGRIKSLLARRIRLKRLPDPKFVLDTTTSDAYRLFDLMNGIETHGDGPDEGEADDDDGESPDER